MTIRQVALLIDTSTDYSVHIIEGIARYAQEHEAWNLLVQPRGERERSLMPHHWRPDGIIARVTHRALAEDLSKRRVPVVNVSLSTVSGFRIPQLTIDERLVGVWAATHLWDCGFRHFGYWGLSKQPNYVDRCGPAFAQRLGHFQPGCTIHIPRNRAGRRHSTLTPADLERWLTRVPKPIGIFVVDSEDAHSLVDACRAGGYRVPDEVAVVVGEDDHLLCQVTHPTLTAIDLGSERIGFEAAALLRQMMSGRRPPLRPRFLPPLRVITRHSTDMLLAMRDLDLASAIRYIRQHASRPIQMRDLLQHIPLSRRTLELRFKKVLGVSPAAEIRRIRCERAKELLISTEMTMSEVAIESGFAHVEIMNRLFQRTLHVTPTQFRRQSRK